MTVLDQTVVDRVEIEVVLGAFARCALTGDMGGLDALLTDDAVVNATAIGGTNVARGDAAGWLTSVLAPFSLVVAIVGDVFVLHTDDVSADVESTWHGVVVPEDTGQPRIVYGLTRDRFVRTNDAWRIARRAVEVALSVQMAAPAT